MPKLHPNRLRLRAFVDACLEQAAAKPPEDGQIFLRRNAQHVERHLRALSAWVARDDNRPPPAHLEGLSAFELSDALDRLNAAQT